MTHPILTAPPYALREALRAARRWANRERDQVWLRPHGSGFAVWPLNNHASFRWSVTDSTATDMRGGFHVSRDAARVIADICRMVPYAGTVTLECHGLTLEVSYGTLRAELPIGVNEARDRRFDRIADFEHPDPLRIGVNAGMTAEMMLSLPKRFWGDPETVMTVSATPDTVIRFDAQGVTGWVTPVAGERLRDTRVGTVKGADDDR